MLKLAWAVRIVPHWMDGGMERLEDSSLLRRAAQELHAARLEVIDAALDLQVPFAHQVAQGFRELQEKVHGVERSPSQRE